MYVSDGLQHIQYRFPVYRVVDFGLTWFHGMCCVVLFQRMKNVMMN